MNLECKIFISSTFKDMQEERDVIRYEILPEIEAYALQYGVNVDIVDLRWGINTDECENSDQSSIKILKTCFDEINICKPFFIGIIGNRYGWIPNLNNVKEAIDMAYQDKVSFGLKSVTEYEMEYALNSYDDDKASFIFCMREKIIGDLTYEQKSIYFSNNEEDLVKIKGLKTKIRNRCANQSFDYQAIVKDNGHLNLNDFKEKLIKKLKEAIDERFSSLRQPQNEIEKEMLLQETIVHQKEAIFSGRKSILAKIDQFYHTSEKILGIYGVSGIGKSSLMSHLITQSLNEKDVITLFFLAGTSANSNFVYHMIVSFIYQLSLQLQYTFDTNLLNKQYVQEHFDELLNHFYLLLKEISKEKKIRIFIDALDQFSYKEEKEVIDWLNAYYLNSLINHSIKIVFSYIPFHSLQREMVLKNILTMELLGINVEDIFDIAQSILTKNKKALPKSCYQLLLEKKENEVLCCSNPLYLSLILQEIINFDATDFQKIHQLQQKENVSDEQAIYRYVYQVIHDAPFTLKEQFLSLIEKSKRKISPFFVMTTLAIISISRQGVREKDIYGIYQQLKVPYESTNYSYFKKIFKLFLKESNGRIDFSHKIFDDILEDLFLNNQNEDVFKINVATVKYLSSLPSEDAFKKHEFLYYLYLIQDERAFSNYFFLNLQDEVIVNSFFELYESVMKKRTTPHPFFLHILTLSEDNFLIFLQKIKTYKASFFIEEKLLFDLLKANPQISLQSMISIYDHLVEIYFYYKDINHATAYANLLQKMLIKYYKKEKKCHASIQSFLQIYQDLLLSKQKIFSLFICLKQWKNRAKQCHDKQKEEWIEQRYLQILLKMSPKLYHRSLKKSQCKVKNIQEYTCFDDWMTALRPLTYQEIFKQKENVLKCRQCAIKDGKEEAYLVFLKQKMQKIEEDLRRHENIELLRVKAYFHKQIGDIKFYQDKQKEAIFEYEKSIQIYQIIIKISELPEDLFDLAEVTHLYEKMNRQKTITSRKIYKQYEKFHHYHIDFFTNMLQTFIMACLLVFVIGVLILGSFYVIDHIYILGAIEGRLVLNVYFLYIYNNLEILLFFVGLILMFAFYSFFHERNIYHPNAIYWKNKMGQYGGLFLFTSIVFFLWIKLYPNKNIDLSNIIFSEYFFVLYNLSAGSYCVVYLLDQLKKCFQKKDKFFEKQNQVLFIEKQKKLKRMDGIILFSFLLITVIIGCFPSIFSSWHNNNLSLISFFLILSVNFLAVFFYVFIQIATKRRIKS